MSFGKRYDHMHIPPAEPGLYALYLNSDTELLIAGLVSTKLLYVGKSESSLKDRSHFLYTSSGASTLRRSLGALLRTELNLTAIPRGNGKSKKDFSNYRFTPNDESKLTDWMNRHLDFSYEVISTDIDRAERVRISELCPPLNLDKCQNERRSCIKKLRKICRNEAADHAKNIKS